MRFKYDDFHFRLHEPPEEPNPSWLLNATRIEAIPGFGGSLATKYGTAEMEQILTEYFDYIRCTNLNDCNLSANNRFGADGLVFPICATSSAEFPITSGSTRGMGRIDTISEIGMHMICTAEARQRGLSTACCRWR